LVLITDAGGNAGWNQVGTIGLAKNAVTSAKVEDNSLTAADLRVNVVSSIDGVVHDGGNIDLVAGPHMTITPNHSTNQITLDPIPGIEMYAHTENPRNVLIIYDSNTNDRAGYCELIG
jgi:hypothetical protein